MDVKLIIGICLMLIAAAALAGLYFKGKSNEKKNAGKDVGELLGAFGWLVVLTLLLGVVFMTNSFMDEKNYQQDLKIADHDNQLQKNNEFHGDLVEWRKDHEKSNLDTAAAFRAELNKANAKMDSLAVEVNKAKEDAKTAKAKANKALKLAKLTAQVQVMQKTEATTTTKSATTGKKGKKKKMSLDDIMKEFEKTLNETL